jgi:hypothetical protein
MPGRRADRHPGRLLDHVGHFVTSKIQTLGGVKDTFTLIMFKAFS